MELKYTFKEMLDQWYQKLKKFFSTPIRKIFILYVVILFIGAMFLWLPISHTQAFKDVTFIDSLFTSASAFSDTGLSVYEATYLTFNFFGQFVIFILIILGGLGLFTLRIFILSFFISKFSYRSYDTVSNEMQGKNKISSIGIVRTAFFVSIVAIIFIGFILGILFFTVDTNPTIEQAENFNNPKGNFWLAIWMGFFTSASAINNAGFDITSSSSFAVYDTQIFIQMIILFLFVLGGIGFPFIYEVFEYFKSKRSGKFYRFSLVSKILIWSYISIAMFGLGFAFILEGLSSINNPDSFFRTTELDLNTGQRIWALTFNTFSTRSAGFSTFDLNYLSSTTLMLYVIMMFIGAGSSSTTGGIRTTTFWILLLSVISTMRGRDRTETFKKTVNKQRVRQSFAIFLFSIILIVFTSTIISISNIASGVSEPNQVLATIFFTSTSAFGAVGLSLTPIGEFTWLSKIILILLMFFGQLGISNTINQFNINKKPVYSYIEEDVVLG